MAQNPSATRHNEDRPPGIGTVPDTFIGGWQVFSPDGVFYCERSTAIPEPRVPLDFSGWLTRVLGPGTPGPRR